MGIMGGMLAQQLELSPHNKKVHLPPGVFLCDVYMFSPYMCGFSLILG